MKKMMPAFRLLSKITLRTWFVLGISALCLSFFIELSSELKEIKEGDRELVAFDTSVLSFISEFRGPRLNPTIMDLSTLGSTLVLTLISFVFIVFMLMLGRYWLATYMFIASIGGAILTTVFKRLFERERPDLVERLVDVFGYSFPSGHSLSSSAIYLTLAILACRRFQSIGQRVFIFLLVFTLIAGIAFSRVYLGVHFPSDTLAGVSLGAAWAFLLGAASPWVESWYEKRWS